MICIIERVAYTTPFMSLFRELGLEREIIKTRWIKKTITVYNHLKCLALFKTVVSDPNDHIPYVLHLRHPGTDPEIVKLSTRLSLLVCRVSVGNSPFLPRESFVFVI